ncbi:MAG: fibronectin type III domain-containing protein, partial [Flavobacteriales bacterium]|nr:fibronectin type III domain-containing protein [Flavobacteriales bacterium]
NGTNHYKIRYKIIGSASWSYKNNIDSILNQKLLTNLIPLSDYIWQIRSHCDTINSNTSNWSVTDTFYTNTNLYPTTNTLTTTNINYNNAVANWDTLSNVNRYKIRYQQIGTGSWSNLGPIYNPNSSTTIPLLQQNTTYEWQVMCYYDTTNLLASLWSISDTFTTPSFVAAPFNPIVINTLSNTQCNTSSELTLIVSQEADEPDIGTSIITSDGGSFDITSINSGDSVGFAIMTTSTQNITATLKAGIVAGQNYAIINSYDSAGILIGFFSIENDNGGIKVSSTSPNDGNNYTSGFISEIHFTNLFINPNIDGPLYFYANINSELNDQFNDIDTVQIWCNSSSISENSSEKNLIGIYDIFGREIPETQNKLLFFKYTDGTIEKRLLLK